MAQEFFIKSTNLEDKIRQILPSQGGLGAGFDLSASTQIIPIVDLTESAEGSILREDLQRSISFSTMTTFNVADTSTVIINTTGFFRIFGFCNFSADSGGARAGSMTVTDGTTTKTIFRIDNNTAAGASGFQAIPIDYVIKLEAGESVTINSFTASVEFSGSTRQIADVNGELTNP